MVIAQVAYHDVSNVKGAKEFVAELHNFTEDDAPKMELPDHSELKTYAPGWKPEAQSEP